MSTDVAPMCRCLVCHDYGDRDRLDAVDASLVGSIADKGWGVLMIPPDNTSAGWAFTVGLWHSFRTPEIAMFGLDPSDMMCCLNSVGDQVAAGRTLTSGDELDDVVGECYLVSISSIDPGWHRTFFGTSLGFYRKTRPVVPFLQLLWPDRVGRFPTQQGFAAELRLLQPQLWLSPDHHPEGPWLDQL